MLRLSSKSFLAQIRRTRCFHSSSSVLKAEFFRMPAMSPTMEKGGVTDWKFKEGESFNGGDVLLEVETDKSQIDVEAQDDGVVAKILLQNGATDIPVGTPIAIIAEPGDDLATLELPKEEDKQTSSQPPKSSPEPSPEPVKEEPKPSIQKPSTPTTDTFSKANPNQIFFPSVASLLAENNISREEALSKISATGPKGRIIKGDVLAHLGKISKESVNKISSFIESHSKLDLSNIERLKITPKQPVQSAKESEQVKPAKKEPKTIIKTFNLESLLELQASTSEKGLKPFTINSYIEKASKKAETYAYKTHPEQSDFYDPIFESLVAPDAQTERFSINLDIPVKSKQNGGFVGPIDAFDLFDAQDALLDSSLPNNEFTVKLTINEKAVDAEEKAKLYLNKLESYIYHI